MELEIQLTSSPLPERQPAPVGGDIGAWVEFRGLVRGREDDAPVRGLEYEAYAGMAEREIRRVLEELNARGECALARVVHRVGAVPVGEAAIYVGIGAPHRAGAFALLSGFMDRLKQDVPVWKTRALAATAATPAPTSSAETRSADEVRALLREICPPLDPERAGLRAAAGRVLRETICAPEDQPAFDRSSVDGYAVRLDDPASEFRIIAEIRAGEWKPLVLGPGEAVRVATGGALPGERLQVIMKEETRVVSDRLTVLRRDEERNIRFRGEDARAGRELIPAGTRLEPGTLALLASVGCARPLVARLPRVVHLATGNELVDPEEAPGRGQIRDSNTTLVRAFFQRQGITPEQRRAGEDADAIRAALAQSAGEADLLLISGGASVGEHDFTRRLLAEAGYHILVSKTSARPGKPLIVGQRGRQLALGLPGNPLAHFVCLNLYARVALDAWSGVSAAPDFGDGFLAVELAAGGNARETFWPGRWDLQHGRASVRPLRWSSSGDLTSLAAANALIRVPGGAGHFGAGARVEFLDTTNRS